MESAVELLARFVVLLACLSMAAAGALVLARERHDEASRPAPLERRGGPLAAVNYLGIGAFVPLGLLTALSLWGTVRPIAGPADSVMRLAGVLVVWAAGLLALWGLRSIGNQMASAAEVRPDTELVTDGAFGLVRHPLYLSILLLWAGGALALLSWVMAACCLVLIPLFVARARAEEELLTRHLGSPYRRYAERVPMLLPGWPRRTLRR